MNGWTKVLNPNELHYYPLIISLDRWNGRCNTVKEPFSRIGAPNKIEDVKQNESIQHDQRNQ